MTDSEILRHILKRHQRGLERAIDQYGAYVATVIRNVLGTAGTMEDCQELSGDVFFALWQHPDHIQPEKLRPWLGAVARNRARDLLRSRKTTLPMEEDVLELPGISTEEQVMHNLTRQMLLDAVKNMPCPDKDIFLLYYYHYDTMEEISERLEIPLGTVKSKLYRGKQRLRDILLQEEVEP